VPVQSLWLELLYLQDGPAQAADIPEIPASSVQNAASQSLSRQQVGIVPAVITAIQAGFVQNAENRNRLQLRAALPVAGCRRTQRTLRNFVLSAENRSYEAQLY